MYALRLPVSKPVRAARPSWLSRAGTAATEWLRIRLGRFSARREFQLFHSRRLGLFIIEVEDYYGEWGRHEDRLFDVWKEGQVGEHSDLFDGLSDFKDLWRYRGWTTYFVRIGFLKLGWESGLALAILERRREVDRKKSARHSAWMRDEEEDDDTDDDARTSN